MRDIFVKLSSSQNQRLTETRYYWLVTQILYSLIYGAKPQFRVHHRAISNPPIQSIAIFPSVGTNDVRTWPNNSIPHKELSAAPPVYYRYVVLNYLEQYAGGNYSVEERDVE